MFDKISASSKQEVTGFAECKHSSQMYFDFHFFCKEQDVKQKHWKHFSVHITNIHSLFIKLEYADYLFFIILAQDRQHYPRDQSLFNG